MIACARCGDEVPLDLDELVSDGGGDAGVLPVIVPPDGCIGDPDGDGVVCGECAEPSEIQHHMRLSALAERLSGG
jgi:hypothetical protein